MPNKILVRGHMVFDDSDSDSDIEYNSLNKLIIFQSSIEKKMNANKSINTLIDDLFKHISSLDNIYNTCIPDNNKYTKAKYIEILTDLLHLASKSKISLEDLVEKELNPNKDY